MNISKFSWAELFSNNSGKTSMASFAGLLLIILSGIPFSYSCFIKDYTIMNACVVILTMATGLILGKKIVDGKQPVVDNTDATVEEKVDNPDENI